jgi:hypothetical protein
MPATGLWGKRPSCHLEAISFVNPLLKSMSKTKLSFANRVWRNHSLGIASVLLLCLWLFAYMRSDPDKHWGAFFGNAIADWSGSVVIIFGTKFLVEIGSKESNPVRGHKANAVLDFLWEHSLLLFLGITGLGWALLYSHMDPTSKWGQVVGNVVSEWLQMAGLVFMTKGLVERGSKE